MLSERDVELAHPEAFDFAFGNLTSAQQAEFNLHLVGCRYCQGVIDEYSEIGRIIKNLPPHVEPPPGLEDRTVAAMLAFFADQRARPDRRPDAEDRAATRIYPIPERQPPVWRRYRGGLVAVAAAIITAAIVVPLSLAGGRTAPAQAAVVIPLHATAAAKLKGDGAATGRATARQDASGSWHITLTVQHLKHFDPEPWYGCWYVSRDGRQVASAGTFLVPASGRGTFSMTSAVDPHGFPTMEITIQPPSKNGARAGTIILIGQKL